MYKRIGAALLCICLLAALVLPAAAAEDGPDGYMNYTVSSLDGFLRLTEGCRLDSFSRNLRVILQTDLDLNGTGFEGIPIFSGIFEGNGHTVKGLNLSSDGSHQGLFRYLTQSAQVLNLRVIGTVQPGGSGSEVGGIAGKNEGFISGCTFTGSVSGNEYVGGIAGVNTLSGVIEDCSFGGKLYGTHFVGGITGENRGVIRGCINEAKINDTAVENRVELTDITLSSLTGSESVSTVTDIGGIAGSSIGVIRECENRGDVGYKHMGYNIGGIAGTQSGALLDSNNYGTVQGRKEVGGIVGQLEPTAMISYAEDALQILERQLRSMGAVVSQTVSNVQDTSSVIVGQVANLQSHVFNAKDAVESLIPDKENPELPDLDSIRAAQNTISSSISGMTNTLQGMSDMAYGSMGAMSTNLYALQNQIDSMRVTLGNASETLGGSLTDVSDLDTEEDFTGKLSGCVNYGSVLADRNAGGIAGAIAMENDLDYEEDWSITGQNSLNFESELRAVITTCVNTASVTGRKQNVGGIVGLQSMGLVKNCINSGWISAEDADHVGGISGQSLGYIRSSSAKCVIGAKEYVGGIAGSATVVTDCRSLVRLEDTGEKRGSILGYAEEPYQELEEPVSGNFYLSADRDMGAIDGISYGGKAEPATYQEFLKLENLPDMFRNVTVTFRYPNGQERQFSVELGDSLDMQWVPPIPPRSGYAAVWAGLEEEDLEKVLFDMTYEVEYTGASDTLRSDLVEGERPVMLVQGVFGEGAAVRVQPGSAWPALKERQELLYTWEFSVSGAQTVSAVRLLIPETAAGEDLVLLLGGPNRPWREAEHSVEGSYAVAALEQGETWAALVQSNPDRTLPMILGASALVLALILLVQKHKERKK